MSTTRDPASTPVVVVSASSGVVVDPARRVVVLPGAEDVVDDDPAAVLDEPAAGTDVPDGAGGSAANGSPASIGQRTVETLHAAYRSAAQDGTAMDLEGAGS